MFCFNLEKLAKEYKTDIKNPMFKFEGHQEMFLSKERNFQTIWLDEREEDNDYFIQKLEMELMFNPNW